MSKNIKVFGIEIEFHWSFVLLFFFLLAFTLVFLPEDFFFYLFFFVALFLSVLIHEFMHSLMAISKGIKVRKIILLPIGGLALTEGTLKNPKDEFLIAIVGPLFNIAVAILIVLVSNIFSLPFPTEEMLLNALKKEEALTELFKQMPLFTLYWINMLLGLFNLLPAFPMDGGRILRSFLSMFLGQKKATIIAVNISKILAILMFIYAFLIGHILLLFIAIFVFLGAEQEKEVVFMKDAINSVDLLHVIDYYPLTIDYNEPLINAIRKMHANKIDCLLVKKGNNFYELSLDTIASKNKINAYDSCINYARKLPKITLRTKKEKIFEYLFLNNYCLLPIVKKGVLLGVITKKNVEEELRFLELFGKHTF